jgi:two-component system response regulator DevR
MKDKARVLILCCNRLVRESIARILAKKTDFEVIASQAVGCGSREETILLRADVLVLDSIEFLLGNPLPSSETDEGKRLIKCVLVAMEDDRDRFLTAIRHGALGYVLQEASAVDVVSTIQMVAEGQAVCPPAYTRFLFDSVASQSRERPNMGGRTKSGLTCREQQLIPMIGSGLSNKEIAAQLNLSEQTVKNHVHRILRKVGVPNRLSIFEAFRLQTVSSSPRKYSEPA